MPTDSTSGGAASEITPELVQQVADKVYELWRQELRIARERARGRARGKDRRRDSARRIGVKR